MASALKKLVKEPPTKDDINRAVKELNTDGVRGCAVLAHALLEDMLRQCILANMTDLNKDEQDRLFVGSGPLSSFSSKIQLAYAFKIIGTKTRHDLDTIREIRNAIAHTSLKIDFDTPEVASLCAGLHCLNVAKESRDSNFTPRQKFVVATKILMIHFIGRWDGAEATASRGIPSEFRDLG